MRRSRALAFKIMNDPFVGSLTFMRIYSGTLVKGTYLNSVKDKKEKVGRMLLMHANSREDIDEAYAGDIVALAGMKETTTGDTLCAERSSRSSSSGWNSPSRSSSCRWSQDQGRPGKDGHRAQSPRRRGSVVPRLDRSRIGPDHHQGHGRASPRNLVDRMKREFKVEANVGAPQVAYREYLAKPVDIDYTHKKQSGGSGQFGRVKVTVIPGRARFGLQFFDEIKGGNIPKEYIPSVEKGFRETPRPARSSASRSSTSRCTLRTARTTTSTRRRWRSKSALVARCAKLRRRLASSCSNRS
jgi:elongation factor G